MRIEYAVIYDIGHWGGHKAANQAALFAPRRSEPEHLLASGILLGLQMRT